MCLYDICDENTCYKKDNLVNWYFHLVGDEYTESILALCNGEARFRLSGEACVKSQNNKY